MPISSRSIAAIPATVEALSRARGALSVIVEWTEAYPLQAFAEVDLDACREKLGDDLYAKLHASWARHILGRIEACARDGLGRPEPPPPEVRQFAGGLRLVKTVPSRPGGGGE